MKKNLFLAVAIAFLALAFIGCNSSTPDLPWTPSRPDNPDVVLPVSDGTVWYYRAFGQSSDLGFQENTSAMAQIGVNYVWINPSFLAAATDKTSIPVHLSNTATSHNGTAQQNSTFIPTAAQIDEALKANEPVNFLKPGTTPGQFVQADADGVVLIESRGGKWANTHMGLSFFFTVLPTDRHYKLTATLTRVHQGGNPLGWYPIEEGGRGGVWGGMTVNGQSGMGMVAMDIVNPHRAPVYVPGFDELPAVSNIVGLGNRGNNNNVGNLIYDGNTQYGVALGMPNQNTGQATNSNITQGGTQVGTNTANAWQLGDTLTFVLERDDDGFYKTVIRNGVTIQNRVQMAGSNNGRTGNFVGADAVMRVDEDKMYWGFTAVRQGRLMVENVILEDMGPVGTIVTSTPPRTAANITPNVNLRSGTNTAVSEYTLSFRATCDGALEIKSGENVIFSKDVLLSVEEQVNVTLQAGANSFSWTFDPDDERANSQTQQTGSWTVTYNETAAKTIWAAPASSGDGDGSSRANAMAVSTALTDAQP